LKELIDECREREKRISENSKRSYENLTQIDESLQSFSSTLYEIRERTEKLADDLLGIYLHFYNSDMASS